MSATQSPTRTMRSKLTVKDLGNPKKANEDNPTHLLGRIIGVATGLKTKVMPSGDAYEAIIGTFEGTRADTGEIIESGVLYLPGGFHEQVVEQLRTEGVNAVQFAYDVASVVANNPIGYSYAFKPLVKPAASSPLETLRMQIAAPMPASETMADATASPADDKPKAKSKAA